MILLSRPKALRFALLEPWQRNLYVLWLAQAISSLGFSFVFPFIPLFVQELGVEEPGQAALWSGVAGGIGGFFMVLSGPFWGILGDRYGRKKNVLRAMIGSAIVLALTGLVTDVYQLVAARIVLGLVSGTWVTVMALGSAMAPRHKVPFTIGVVQSASFLGFTAGPFVGGLLADNLGFRVTFFITGALCAFAGLMVQLFVREGFRRPEGQERLGPHLVLGSFTRLMQSRALASVLLVLFLVQLGPTVMMPALPLFIGMLSASGAAASSAGVGFSIMGLTGAASSLVVSRLSQRLGMTLVLVVAFIGGALLYLPLLVVNNLAQVYVVLAFLGFFNGGLNTLSYALVGTSVPADKQGAAYGVAQSASSLGWGSGPLLGGAVAGVLGLRQVFLVNSVVLFLTSILAARLLGKTKPDGKVGEAEPAASAAAQ